MLDAFRVNRKITRTAAVINSIKKYNVSEKITAFKSLLGFFAMIVLTFASKIIIRLLTERIFGQAKFENVFISYISITIFLSAVFLFLFCLNIKISDAASKPIYFLAPVSLGVYLIHVHPLVFEFLLKDAFASFANKPLAIMVLYVLVAALLIFAVCTQ